MESQKLELLVLKGKAKSGYPKRQLERAGTLRYRLSTVGLVLANFLLSLFCFRMAANSVQAQEDDKERSIGWTIFCSFVALTVLEVPLLHCFFNNMLQQLLEEEYFETADLVPTNRDDSTLSSHGSDMYLHGLGHRTLSSTLSQ